MARVGRVASQRSTGRRSRASNCHSISTGSSPPGPFAFGSDIALTLLRVLIPLPDARLPRSRGGAAVTCEPVARRTMTAELPSQTDVVQAAGGLVVRRQSGLLEIVVVHRPVQHDWSFPKGKLEQGETLEMAALREVREETGMICDLLRFIGTTEYVARTAPPKAGA